MGLIETKNAKDAQQVKLAIYSAGLLLGGCHRVSAKGENVLRQAFSRIQQNAKTFLREMMIGAQNLANILRLRNISSFLGMAVKIVFVVNRAIHRKFGKL